MDREFFMAYTSTWNWMILSINFALWMLFLWLLHLYGFAIGLFAFMVIATWSALQSRRRLDKYESNI